MADSPEPKIVHAEQLDNGVVVRFDDGETAIYPALLLYAAIGLSEALNEAKIRKENGRGLLSSGDDGEAFLR